MKDNNFSRQSLLFPLNYGVIKLTIAHHCVVQVNWIWMYTLTTQLPPMSGHAHCSQSNTQLNCSRNWTYLFTRCLKPWFSLSFIAEYASQAPKSLMALGVSESSKPCSPRHPAKHMVRKAEAPEEGFCHHLSWDNPSHLHREGLPRAEKVSEEMGLVGLRGGRAVVSNGNQNQSSQIQSFSCSHLQVYSLSQLSLCQLIPKARCLGDLKGSLLTWARK